MSRDSAPPGRPCEARRRPPVQQPTTVSLYGEPSDECPTCHDTGVWDPQFMPGVPLHPEPVQCPTCTTL
jgi:hypothetical protein